MSARHVAAILIGGASAGLLATNCFVAGFVRVEAGLAGADAGSDSGSDADADADPGCLHATWPGPPAEPDPGSDSEDFVVASRSLSFGETDLDNGPTVGYDLDNRCTCQGEGANCNSPEWATADHCDGPEGRDNAWAHIFQSAAVFDQRLSSESYSTEMAQGKFSLLIRVRRYNGLANDDNVWVALYPSGGLGHDDCLGADPVPAWDGADRWPIVHTSLMGSGGAGGGVPVGGGGGCGGGAGLPPGYDYDQPRFEDDAAYVNDGTVVANLPNVEIVLPGSSNSTSFALTAGFLTGELERDGTTGRWVMRNGLLVGRFKVSQMFLTMSSLATGGEQICTDNPIYGLLKNAICKFPDVASELPGPTTPCDAISFGMAFEAEEAQLGAVYAPDGLPQSCPAETDPTGDTCETL